MIRNASFSPRAYDEVLTKLQHSILALELDLRQLTRVGAVKGKAFEKRARMISDLKKHWEKISKNKKYLWRHHTAYDSEKILPDLERATNEELDICRHFLTTKRRIIHNLKVDTGLIRDWSNKVFLSKRASNLQVTFYLSKIRKFLIYAERYSNQLSFDSENIDNYANNICQACRVFIEPPSPFSIVKYLQKLCQHFKDKEAKVVNLRLQILKDKEEARWMESWLALQEQRLNEYWPILPLPDY